MYFSRVQVRLNLPMGSDANISVSLHTVLDYISVMSLAVIAFFNPFAALPAGYFR